jgi:hypothetical protein
MNYDHLDSDWSKGGPSREAATELKIRRKKKFGDCAVAKIREMPLKLIWLEDAQGREPQWNQHKRLHTHTASWTVGQALTITLELEGAVVLKPIPHTLPMKSGEAHCFREVCLNVVANYPELV